MGDRGWNVRQVGAMIDSRESGDLPDKTIPICLAVRVDDGGEAAIADDARDDDQTVVRAFDEYRVAMKLPALTGC
jgi:hypothetical protein